MAFLVGLGWLGWRSLEQDEQLETQRLRVRLEDASNLIAAELRQRLADLEVQLDRFSAMPSISLAEAMAGFSGVLGDDALVVVFDPRHVQAFPRRRLIYYPVVPAAEEPYIRPLPPGRPGEQVPDLASQIDYFEVLGESEDPRVRADAQLGLARTQAALGRADEALGTYARLNDPEVLVDGRPAELVARFARCEILVDTGRRTDLVDEVRRLDRDLHEGRWQLTRPAYLHSAGETRRLMQAAGLPADPSQPNPAGLSLAMAVDAVWQQWQEQTLAGTTPMRASRTVNGRPVLLISRAGSERLVVLAAGRGFLQDRLVDPLATVGDLQGVRVGLEDGEGQAVLTHGTSVPDMPTALRTMAETRLPWNLRIVTANLATDQAQFATRRQLVMSGLLFLALFVVAGSYLSVRAMTREIEAIRLKSDFVAAVSHEFRTPLTLLRQFSDLLAENRVTSEQERQRYYAALQRGTRRLTRLVEDLLDFGRMEAGSRAFKFDRVLAREWILGVVAEFQEEVRGRGYRVDLVWTGDPGIVVQADAGAIGRVLWNLLDNAVKYSPDSKGIWVTAAFDDGMLTISVRDRGLGNAADEQRAIFGKFVRGSSTGAHRIEGTGLGLALVEQIVEAHGGSVALDSQVGEGSTFSFSLPAIAEPVEQTRWRAS